MVNLWVSPSDLEGSNYDPDSENIYYLYTRNNPDTPQIIVYKNADSLTNSYYDVSKCTAVLIHGWRNSIASKVFYHLIKGCLAGEDMNVIAMDWSAGANTLYALSVLNAVPSGQSLARFVKWMNSVTGGDLSSFHIIGHSNGAHVGGIAGRELKGDVSYVTGLDPAGPGWVGNVNRFNKLDGKYTEVIHTSCFTLGYGPPLGCSDFYPNKGVSMPGCSVLGCSHSRSFEYMGESLANGGFTGTLCSSYENALIGACDSCTILKMGGLLPKTGQSGVYYLETNAAPLYSQG